MVLDVAKNLYPDADSIEDLTKSEQKRWLTLACNMLYNAPDASRDRAEGEVIDQAEAALRTKRAEAEEREREKREETARQIMGQRWQFQTKVWTQRLQQEGGRETNGCWIERILAVMMVVAFAVGLGLLVAAALAEQANPGSQSTAPWALAIGSGATGLLSLIMLGLHRLRISRQKLDPLPEIAPPSSAPEPGESSPRTDDSSPVPSS